MDTKRGPHYEQPSPAKNTLRQHIQLADEQEKGQILYVFVGQTQRALSGFSRWIHKSNTPGGFGAVEDTVGWRTEVWREAMRQATRWSAPSQISFAEAPGLIRRIVSRFHVLQTAWLNACTILNRD